MRGRGVSAIAVLVLLCSAAAANARDAASLLQASQRQPAFTADGRAVQATTTPGPYTFTTTFAMPTMPAGVTRPNVSPWTPVPGENPNLPHGARVTQNQQNFEVQHLPTARPTLEPERHENFSPVQSPLEAEFERNGPTQPPERDCVRSPEYSQCECREMTRACAEASYECEVHLQNLQEKQPGVLNENYKSKFDHPLLNTLSLDVRTQRSGGGAASRRSSFRQSMLKKGKSEVSGCRACFDHIAEALRPPPSADGGATLLQQEEHRQDPEPAVPEKRWGYDGRYDPPTSGWRIDNEEPEWVTWYDEWRQKEVQKGDGKRELGAMEECLSYFWACDGNRRRLDTWIHAKEAETEWVDANAATRPGLYQG